MTKPSDEPRVEERFGAQVPLALRLRTSQGASIELRDVLGNGKPTLLVLAYSHCTMLCNLVLRAMADLVPKLRARPGRDLNLVTISIDPHELPAEAARTQQLLLERSGLAGQPSSWPFLVGDQSAIDQVASAVGFHYRWDERTQQYAHPAVLFVLSPEGRVAAYFYGISNDPEAVERALLTSGSNAPTSRRALATAVLSCFRFDSLSQRYGGRIWLLFRVGAVVVFGSLLLLVVRLMRRSREAA